MKMVNVLSAEWNPSNQIITTIADCGDQNGTHMDGTAKFDSLTATKRQIIISNVIESEATAQTVVAYLTEQGLQASHAKFRVD